jgi:hypothetical protein
MKSATDLSAPQTRAEPPFAPLARFVGNTAPVPRYGPTLKLKFIERRPAKAARPGLPKTFAVTSATHYKKPVSDWPGFDTLQNLSIFRSLCWLQSQVREQ